MSLKGLPRSRLIAPLRHRQRGLGLMGAIFVITIMAVIVVGVSNLVVTSKESYGYEILSMRSFLLAESGGQMAIRQILKDAQGSNTDCSAIENLPDAFFNQFPSCRLSEVRCPKVTIPPPPEPGGIDYFTVFSEATCGSGTENETVRKLTLRAQR